WPVLLTLAVTTPVCKLMLVIPQQGLCAEARGIAASVATRKIKVTTSRIAHILSNRRDFIACLLLLLLENPKFPPDHGPGGTFVSCTNPPDAAVVAYQPPGSGKPVPTVRCVAFMPPE